MDHLGRPISFRLCSCLLSSCRFLGRFGLPMYVATRGICRGLVRGSKKTRFFYNTILLAWDIGEELIVRKLRSQNESLEDLPCHPNQEEYVGLCGNEFKA
ncbi:hypothetical protein BRARA_G00111 [Brassica rapa]|uniref:Uncharacterized protein n=1 Tax=Brassica campestris TaxID=3711 RepID=A0A397YGS6_BRACM|nr:hypothetical protein BRARA_G00111 [Brassica rapa]